ncbi:MULTISPECIES: PepSY-associated TM helix domain-containing protein [Shewanella]|uniref:PepSY-associated TM helix domain-containing protein n=1 Tax=Shewanella fidelis TaxID=173509 RepID=A0AAW8NRY1_9GAMM|nr:MULTISPECIES: PepSY-associated TM helix domain-containing protein [Shewanella]MDR8525682.1 PepSY-associated TM helix domain-containing protein [Shewanella fidelis]MDW4812808.1 PepSY-associated TM helix domain-containing protein [Shewanella fidelis]MDW4816556.1 PepSY-associated TM helix domain-containing protein [Shewanella fidelis]MDW4820280.1 PepSY-associated TM helix domain-containing protein [Shewanella fidelis]MDW4825273.1 PepSY-associated TM helix domain-containing protein [Shewanella 
MINPRGFKAKHTGSKINWYRLNRSLHRDVGYLCIGLTLVFAISGIAVNHLRDWNPNYSIVRKVNIVPSLIGLNNETAIVDVMMNSFDVKQRIKANYWSSENELKVFLDDGSNLTANLMSGAIEFEHIEERIIFKSLNRLHLNEAKQAWVIFSDAYALMLIFLATSALFMVKGKHSPRGRKGLLVLIGFLIPLFFIFYS